MAESLAEPGSNGIKPQLYLDTMRELLAADREKDKAVSQVRILLKRLKDAGADLDAVSMVRKLRNLEDDERILRIKSLVRYAQWEGLVLFEPGVDPKAEQAEMFDEPSIEAKQKLSEAFIYNDGNNTQRAGGSRHDNPQMAGSSEYQMWDRGWLDAEQDASASGKPAKTASTERRPRAEKADGEGEAGAASAAAKKEAAAAKPKPAKEPPAPKPKKGTPRAAADGSPIN